jgi:hypothetical protein
VGGSYVDGVSLPWFGELLRIADVSGDGFDDVLVGGPRAEGGRLVYIPGAAAGIAVSGHRVFDQNTPGVPGGYQWTPDVGYPNAFAHSLATGDVTGDGIADVLVGAPGDDVGGLKDAGSVTLLRGSLDGLTASGAEVFTQRLPGQEAGPATSADAAEAYDYFGQSVSALNLDGTGSLEVLVGASMEDHAGNTSRGLIHQLRYEASVHEAPVRRPDAPGPAQEPIAGVEPAAGEPSPAPATSSDPTGAVTGDQDLTAPTATDRPPVYRRPGPGLFEVALIFPGLYANATWVVVSLGECLLAH